MFRMSSKLITGFLVLTFQIGFLDGVWGESGLNTKSLLNPGSDSTGETDSSTSNRSLLDYSLVGIVRTPPLGGALRGEVGRSFSLNEQSEVYYLKGRIRPVFSLQSSGVVNLVGAGVEFFPVAFLGVTVGNDYIHRQSQILGLDCDTYACSGWLTSQYVRLTLAYKKDSLFSVLKRERRFYDARTDLDRNMLETANLIQLSPRNERLNLTTLLVGYQMEEGHVLGTQIQDIHTDSSQSYQNHQFLFYMRKDNLWSYIISAGRFESDLYRPMPQIALAIQWSTPNKPPL